MKKPSLFEILFNKDDQIEINDSVRGNKFFSQQFSGSVTKQLKRIQSRGLFRFLSSFSHLLTHVSTRVYGSALLTFGAVSTMMYLLRLSQDGSILTFIIGLLFVLISIPFLLYDKPLPVVLASFNLTDYIFYELFCMKRHTTEVVVPFPLMVSVIIGFVAAALSFVVPLWQIAVVIGILVCVYVGIESPEFLFLASLFTLPYLRFVPNGEIWLVAAVVFAILSFLVKVLYGKRVIYIEQYDVFIGIMLMMVLISGIFIKGTESFSSSLRMIALSLGYVLAGNIITNRRLAERSVNAVVMSGVLSALVSFAQFTVVLINNNDNLSLDSLSFILARREGMVVFLIAATLLAVGMIRQSSGGISKIAYICSSIILSLSLLLSGELFALVATLIGIAVYFIIKGNIRPGLILPVLAIIPLTLLILPNSFLNLIFLNSPSISFAEDLFNLWDKSLSVFANNILVGIGIGSESFVEEMAALGIFDHCDSSNLFIEFGLEAGVIALIFFLCVLFTRIKHRSINYVYLRNSENEHLSCISGACILSLLAFGAVNYIWSEPSAYYFFWCLFGIGSAIIRVAKKDYDDKVVYYEESSAFDSSVIDIEI